MNISIRIASTTDHLFDSGLLSSDELEQYDQQKSLAAYEAQLTGALLEQWPGAEIEYVRAETLGSAGHRIEMTPDQDDEDWEAVYRDEQEAAAILQDILEAVYTSEAWVR